MQVYFLRVLKSNLRNDLDCTDDVLGSRGGWFMHTLFARELAGANQSFNEGQYKNAVEQYKMILTRYPGYIGVLFNLGQAYLKTKDVLLAQKCFLQVASCKAGSNKEIMFCKEQAGKLLWEIALVRKETETKVIYNQDFYNSISRHSLVSAKKCVPLIMDLISPRSVVDVGCGTGAFLHCFNKEGIQDLAGIDGGDIDKGQLLIPAEMFFPYDLSHSFCLGRKFDLAVSLEVAEHLPEAAADTFIENLTTLAPVIWFSAAIPGQGGVNHINEQWPTYWIEKFSKCGFMLIDCLRSQWIPDSSVVWWYAQNSFLFVKKAHLVYYSKIARQLNSCSDWKGIDVVHPVLYSIKIESIKKGSAS